MLVYYAEYLSPVGKLWLISDGTALSGLYLQRPSRFSGEEMPQLPVFRQTAAWLDAYFAGDIPGELPPMILEGTDFQKRVWGHLMEISYGETCTYGEIAGRIARDLGRERMSAQAVGQAVGSNPISILIPCHRVLGTKDKLTGYAWGLEIKRWLLNHERERKL